MTINGIITNIFPETFGTSQNGKAWRRRDYILTYDNSKPEYPKAIAFAVMGDNIDKFNLQEGVEYELNIDFTAREYQGKAYMSATCWRAKAITVDAATGEIK